MPGNHAAERRHPGEHQPAQERQMIAGKIAFKKAHWAAVFGRSSRFD
jgi:hypothetical protein